MLDYVVTVSRNRARGYIIHLRSLDAEFQRGDIGEKQKPAVLSSELYNFLLSVTKSGDGRGTRLQNTS